MIPRGALTAAVMALALLHGWACATEEARPSIVLITADTLRADRLGCYGSLTTRTPNVDRLAAEGMLFENAASPMPLTRPSHFSLFTSLYPRDHGVVDNAIPLPADLDTLPEMLRDNGYETAAFVGTALLGEGSGADRGFQVLDAPRQRQRRGETVIEKAITWLTRRSTDQPFFLWVHLFDPHLPYAPPPPFRPDAEESLLTTLPEVSWSRLLDLVAESEGELPGRFLEHALSLYDGEVEYLDAQLGVLYEAMEALDLLDRSAVVFTADHGECFDHGIFFEHASCLYDGGVQVPLILRYPRSVAPGRRETAQVELIDIAPTLAMLARLPEQPAFQGRNLLKGRGGGEGTAFLQHPLHRSASVDLRRSRWQQLRSVAGVPTRQVLTDREQLGVRTRQWKYILTGDDEELYDLEADPEELHNLSSEKPEIAARLRSSVQRWRKRHPLHVAEPGVIDPRLRATLEALGYI